MKIAVIGASPSGIEVASHFTEMGAFVRVFEQKEVGGSLHTDVQTFSMPGNWGQVTTKLGRNQLGLTLSLHQTPSIKEYLEVYFLPLARHFSIGKNLMKAKVERVHKRFLSQDEVVPGKTRLSDLFRVVYSIEPMVINDENRESFHNLEEKLGRAVIDSLKDSMEYYEDFDLVFDCTGRSMEAPLGPSGVYAVGEKRISSHPEMIYGLEAFQKHQDRLASVRELGMVGTTEAAAMALICLEAWLKVAGNNLTIMTHENEAFAALRAGDLKDRVFEIMDWSSKIFHREKDEFMAKMEDWKNLDDFVRVKIPKPTEPKARINIYEGVNVTSVDKLIDQPRLFLSIESPEYRKQILKEEIVTLGFDLVLGMNGRKRDLGLFEGLNTNEPGFYRMPAGDLPAAILQIETAEKNILTFFSRA